MLFGQSVFMKWVYTMIRDWSLITSGGGGGFRGGYNFQNHLKEGGTFLLTILVGGGTFFSNLYFPRVEWQTFPFVLHLISRKKWLENDIYNLQRVVVWVTCCRALYCFGRKMSHARNRMTQTYNQRWQTSIMTNWLLPFYGNKKTNSNTTGRERNIDSKYR